jgi:hypothetical protein
MKVPRVTQNKKRIILYGIEYWVKGRKELSDKIAEEVFMTIKMEKRNCLMHTPLYPCCLQEIIKSGSWKGNKK